MATSAKPIRKPLAAKAIKEDLDAPSSTGASIKLSVPEATPSDRPKSETTSTDKVEASNPSVPTSGEGAAILEVLKSGQERFQESLEQASARFDQTRKAMVEGRDKSVSGFKDMSQIAIEATEAQATSIFEASRALLSVKSASEAIEIQTDLARSLIETEYEKRRSLREMGAEFWTGIFLSMAPKDPSNKD